MRQLTVLSGVDPDIDVDARTADANARLADVTAAAQAIGGLDPNIDVDAQTADAAAKLARVSTVAEALDSQPVNIDVDANTAGAVASLGRVAATAESVRARAHTSFGAMAANIGGAMDNVGVRTRASMGLATVAVGGMGAALALGAGAAGVFGLKVAAANEQAVIGFSTLLGSAQRANAFLADLSAFAARTPFELPGLRDAASRFLAVGLEANRVIPIMTVLGDATSAVGTGAEGIDRAVTALSQMQQKGKVTGEEMLQLVEAGIPAWDALAARIGTSVPEAQEKVSAGQAQVNDLFAALETKAGPALQRVTGMMDKQSASLTGLFSTLRDTVGQGLATMMAPGVAAIKEQMPAITRVISDTMSRIGPEISVFMSEFVGLIGKLLPAVTPIMEVLASSLGAAFGAIGPAIEAVTPFIGQIMGAFQQLLVALLPLVPPLTQVLVALLPIIPAMVQIATAVTSALMPVLVPLIGFVARLVEAFLSVKPVLFIVAGVLLAILAPVSAVVAAVIGLAALVVANFGKIRDFVGGALEAVVGFIAALPGRIIGFLASLPERVGFIVGSLVRFWIEAPGHIGGAIFGFFSSLAGRIVGFISALPGAVGNVVRGVVGFFTELPGRIISALAALPGQLAGMGGDIIAGLIRGIRGAAGRLWGLAREIAGDFLGGFKRALGIGSPSKVFMAAGLDIGTGLILGIERQRRAVADAARSLAAAAVPDMGGFTGRTLAPVAASGTMPRAAAFAGSSAGSTTVIAHVTNVYVQVQGSVVAERELLSLVRTGSDRFDRWNGGKGA